METLAPISVATEPCLGDRASLVRAEDGTGNTLAQEYARFTGTWRFLWVEVEGRRVPAEALRHSRLMLTGYHFLLSGDPVTYRGTFTLRPAKVPKEMDVHFTSGPGAGLKALGIYELVGDVYTACFGLPGAERPSEFVSRPDIGHVLQMLRREN
jgi:uncharacterized protein (TIGR03067 family)